MLRVLTINLLLAGAATTAGDNDLESAEAHADTAQATTRSALETVEGIDTTERLADFATSLRRSTALPAGRFPTLADELTDPATLATIAELLDDAEDLAADLGMRTNADKQLSVYVFASFSMPDTSLKALIRQGELAGVPIVLRGLVENSVEATMRRVLSLYKEGETQTSGALIDPTLFARFGVDQVPTVVVAEYAAGACTQEACPTPPHVKIAGDVPLRYALDRIALAKPVFRHELRALMRALEPERQW